MTTNEAAVHKDDHPPPPRPRFSRKCRCCALISGIVILLIAVVLILLFTLFKPKDPTTTIVSASVSGVSPRISLPAVRIELNISLDFLILVYNPNRAAFHHQPGKSFVFYRGNQVGEADISSGRIPPRGSETIPSRLTIEADRFVSDLGSFVGDVLGGEVALDTKTRIPGRVSILGVFKRHAVALVDCHVVIGFPNLKIKRQDCQRRTEW